MSDYDPSELLLVCDSIIEDGELTYDELYKLQNKSNRSKIIECDDLYAA